MGENDDTLPPEDEAAEIGTVTAEADKPAGAPRLTLGRRLRIRALKTVVGLLLGVMALAAIVIFGIDTGPGHRFVAEQIAALRFENGMRIRVGRIEGSLYGRMTLHDLSVSDPQGEFLFSPQIDVDWRPFAYLRRHVDVRSASSEKMVLRRTPKFRPTPPSNEPLLPDLDIDVGHLRIGRFIAEPPVAGVRRILTVDGRAHIASGRAQVFARGGTIAIAGKQGGDRFDLQLDAVPARNRLALKADLDAPTGGVIAALGGFRQPLALRVDGKGDWKVWNGRFDADLGGGEMARLALTARDGTFTIKGPTRVARLFTGPTAGLVGPVTNLDLTAVLDKRRAKLSGLVSSDAFTLRPDGIIDLAENSFKDLKLQFALLKPAVLARNLSGSGLAAHLTLDGAFTRPKAAYRITAAHLMMNDMGLEGLSAEGAARVDADKILVPVAARVKRIVGLDTVAGGTLNNVRLDGDVAINGTRVLSDNMRLKSDRVDAKLLLVADVAKGFYTGAIDGKIDNYRLESVGIFDIRTNMDLKSEQHGFGLEGTVHARSRKLLNASLESYLGGNFAASSRVRYGSDGIVRFSSLRMNAPDLKIVDGQGSWSPDGRIALVARGTSDRYGALGVRVAGTVASPDAHLTAEHPGFGIGLANLDARITGIRGGYRFDVKSDTDYGPLKADVSLQTGRQLAMQINSANLSGVDFAGQLTQTPAGPFAGALTAQGNGIGGSLRLAGQGKYQAVDFNLRAKDAVFPGPANLTIGSALIDGRAVLYDQPTVIADAQLAGTSLGAVDLAAARVLVDYHDGRGQAKALVEGVSGVPFRLGVNADLAPELWRVALSGRVRGQTLRTMSPARIVLGKDGYELLPTTLSFGRGTARVAGSYGAGMKLETRLENMDVAVVNAFVPGYGLGGRASGSLDFEQAAGDAFPRADARLTINDFTRTSSSTVSQPVDMNFLGRLVSDGAEAHAVIRKRGSVIGRMEATLRPLPPGDGTWSKRLLDAPLGGGIRFNGPADTLFSFVGQSGQTFSGPIGLAADFSCKLADPCVNGLIKGRDMTYENQVYGTKLTNMSIEGRFTGNSFELQSLNANAGGGTVSASGRMSLAAAAGYPMDLTVKLDRARLARNSSLSASASGTLSVTKRAGETALLSGELRLPETRYEIVREGAVEVPHLTGVRFKPKSGPSRVTGDEQAEQITTAFSSLRFDLHVKAADKLYVSGMGLDSEWSADFTVGGTSAAPTMSGDITLIRGNLDFAGRSFSISDGKISFNGGRTIDPSVQIKATESIEDVNVTVSVSGRAYNPQIEFSSDPSLPEDEVLSRILFGSSIANLSAIQAVQLASSLNSLRASGGGLNPLGKLRSATGIDRLRILSPDQATGRGTALAAGQYLTDNIYVELITDARGFTATQIEVSVTHWLSMLSQAGGSGVNSLSVKIKKDY